MNKIAVNNDINEEIIVLDKDTIITNENDTKNVRYVIKKDIKVFQYIKNGNMKITYEVSNNFTLNIFAIDASLEIDLNLNKENININYNYSTLNKKDNVYKININHNEKNQVSKITNHGINLENNDLKFIVNTIVPKKSIKIETSQDSKIILLNDRSGEICPNLIIDNHDIEANHSAYIGDFKSDEIFYLRARGLTLEEAKRLLAKSFIIGGMDISYREINMILQKLNSYWR